MIVRDIVLAIKPKYAKTLYSGEKQFELRRKLPHSLINHVYLYESRPVKKITGCITLKRVVTGSPDKVWQICASTCGLDKPAFETYCGERPKIYALEIAYATKFAVPLDPYTVFPRFVPPQNFHYLPTALGNKLPPVPLKEDWL
ncbi:hypothetical protein [Candidatus Bathycorpusculum sp.]|uniref:hypothetical protein n=1 Tax=Candidatus Bathycorpusculum sp. TaxID=2994959 RepID=UPI0028294681|nr:hypothetical protein [Candidatus Termitimicrobium sp.]MCL2432083.1 hypothetical protein [Candidatus Termitimicrobium sp.]